MHYFGRNKNESINRLRGVEAYPVSAELVSMNYEELNAESQGCF
jgi:hypothetical protein